MCIARVGKVLTVKAGKATVQFFDGRTSEGVDLSIVAARKGDNIEVFGNVALSRLGPAEVRRRRALWKEINEALAKERPSSVPIER